MSKVTHVVSNDWEGIYLEDDLVMQFHQLTAIDVFNYLKVTNKMITIDNIESVWANDWLEDEGYLPETLQEFMEKNNE